MLTYSLVQSWRRYLTGLMWRVPLHPLIHPLLRSIQEQLRSTWGADPDLHRCKYVCSIFLTVGGKQGTWRKHTQTGGGNMQTPHRDLLHLRIESRTFFGNSANYHATMLWTWCTSKKRFFYWTSIDEPSACSEYYCCVSIEGLQLSDTVCKRLCPSWTQTVWNESCVINWAAMHFGMCWRTKSQSPALNSGNEGSSLSSATFNRLHSFVVPNITKSARRKAALEECSHWV